MKLFADKFIQTLVFNLATIAAIVVGLVQFGVRAFNENEGAEKVRYVIQIVLLFVDTIVTKLQVLLHSDVPVAKVSTTRWLLTQSVLHYIRTWENHMEDTLWTEIQDAPGEIFDMEIPELKQEKFDFNEYINANYDYWNENR